MEDGCEALDHLIWIRVGHVQRGRSLTVSEVKVITATVFWPPEALCALAGAFFLLGGHAGSREAKYLAKLPVALAP